VTEETKRFEQLFRQWASVDPERCKEAEEMFDVQLSDSWFSVFSLRISPNPSATCWAIVQAVVQEALYARHLRFRITDVSNHLSGTPVYEVDVMRDDFEYLVEREYSDPAYGLLDSYVKAIELARDVEGIECPECRSTNTATSLAAPSWWQCGDCQNAWQPEEDDRNA
jgi:hypothetical protein